MHHDCQKIIFHHNFHLFFPICDKNEFGIFQLLENFKKIVLMHRPVAKDRPWLIAPVCQTVLSWPKTLF